MVPAAAHLLPPEPVSPLPRQRKVGEERRAGLPTAFLDEYTAWRSAYERGTPSPLSDSVEGRSGNYMAQFDAALFWLTDAIGDLNLADPCTLTHLRAIAHPDWIRAAARAVLAGYDEDGEPVNPDVSPPLSLRTLKTYLGRLRLLFADLGCAIAAQEVTKMREESCGPSTA